MDKRVEKAVQYMLDVAADDSHGYSQAWDVREGNPDYDCSSLVIHAFREAGYKLEGATYTGDMKQAFLKDGFVALPARGLLQRGDVLLNEVHHTAVYIGGGEIVHASGSETGGKYGKPGDQTGREICTRNYYVPSYGWDCLLRYPDQNADQEKSEDVKCMIELRELKKGMKGEDVKALQNLLNLRMKAGLSVDGDFGSKTAKALDQYHRKYQLTPYDQICGKKTWESLLTKV